LNHGISLAAIMIYTYAKICFLLPGLIKLLSRYVIRLGERLLA